MNIVLLTRYNPSDISVWSGILYHVFENLKKNHNVEVVGIEIIQQLNIFSKDSFSRDISFPVGRYFDKLNKLFSERINMLKCDLVFFGDLYFIPLDINIPLVVLSDMTYEQKKKYYTVPDEGHEECLGYEKILLDSTYKIIFSSEWIKQKAIDHYHIDAQKIEIVELGANIPTPSNYSIKMNMDICQLVFIGVDWERKGGAKLLETYEILKNAGFPCTLTIIGSNPVDINDIKDLTVYPSLDKSNPSELEKLCKILSESHFLVLPTNFDAFGIVFCEASAYALPSITADVGGVSQAVKEGKNGYLLPADATAKAYAEKIQSVFNDREGYLKLRQSSRNEFEERLNWDVWGEKVNKILENAVDEWNARK